MFSEQKLFSPDEAGLETVINNHYYYGENLAVLQHLNQAEQPKLKLIYIDPPYMSQLKYQSVIMGADKKQHAIPAFEDRWENDIDQYLSMLYSRLYLMHQLLEPDGSIFVHVDWHVSHYVRLLLDEIFGREHFINEIIWCYSGGGNARRNLQRKHDTIFWYGRSQAYTFHPQYRPYTRGTLERGLTAVKGDRYQLSEKGAALQDWWTDINKILSPTAYENVKYPTQKPKKLLARLLHLASNPGDLVADFFAGSGTVAEVCNEMNRNWILCDNSHLAMQTSLSRLIRSNAAPFAIHALDKLEDQSPWLSDWKEAGLQGAVLHLQKPVLQENGPGNYWLSVGISFYQPTDLPDDWDAADFASYIDFWEIDPDYDGKIFRSQYQLLRDRKNKTAIPLNVLLSVPKMEKYTMAIKIYDCFARQTLVKFCFEPD